MKWGRELNKIKRSIVNEYEDKSLEEIENKYDREIVRIIRGLDERYKDNRKQERGKGKSLENARGIKKWVNENKIKPRRLIKGVKTAKKGEKETKEQEEIRLGQALAYINTNIMEEYEGIDVEKIEDEQIREIVSIIRPINEEYGDSLKKKSKYSKQIERKTNFVKKLGNQKMGKMIINLIKTKNATEEQVKTIAEFYRVDLKKVLNDREER